MMRQAIGHYNHSAFNIYLVEQKVKQSESATQYNIIIILCSNCLILNSILLLFTKSINKTACSRIVVLYTQIIFVCASLALLSIFINCHFVFSVACFFLPQIMLTGLLHWLALTSTQCLMHQRCMIPALPTITDAVALYKPGPVLRWCLVFIYKRKYCHKLCWLVYCTDLR